MDEITPEVGPAQATDRQGEFTMHEPLSGWRLFKAFLRRPVVLTGAFRRHRARKRDKAMLKEALRIQRLTDPERARLDFYQAVFASLEKEGMILSNDGVLRVAPQRVHVRASDGITAEELERIVREDTTKEIGT